SNKFCLVCRCLGCSAVMSLSGLVVVFFRRAPPLCFFLRLSAYSALFFLIFCLVFLQAHTATHSQKMHIAVDLNASFVVHAGSYVWLLSSSVAVKSREERGSAQPESPFPRVWCTACDRME
ncbi:hypothetical protein TcCL_NonESM12859, partial [Trypanosoma cruzi]